MAGFWRKVGGFFGASAPVAEFDSAPRPIDQVFVDMLGRGASPRIGREEALSVPAVQRGRNLICSISTLPLVQLNPSQQVVRNSLLEQLDPDVPNVVTLAQTVEDLVFESISWWLITAQDFAGFPLAVRHLDVSTVSLTPPEGVYVPPNPLPSGEDPRRAVVWVDGVETPASRVIRFDSPNPPLLKVGGRAIRRALLLDKAAAMYADDPRPLDFFSPAEGADPVDDDEVGEILAEWKAARKKRSTGYVPAALKYNTVSQPSPAELQLAELQKQAGLEIANALGIDPEELGISTTSRTYFNAVDRRQSRINDVYSPYMKAIADRLSMGDVTRRGHKVAFNLDDYLRADPITRVQYYQGLKALGVITPEEIAKREGLPPLPADAQPAPPPPPPADAADPNAQPEGDASVDASTMAGLRFADDQPSMTFATFDFANPPAAPVVDVEKRTITGLALPYNTIVRKYGVGLRFLPGSLQYSDVSRVKHLKDHTTPVGVTLSVEDTKAGPIQKLSVLSGPEGSAARIERDQLLYDAQNGLYDGLSVGVDFSLDPEDGDVVWNERDQVYDVKRASWRETSTTPMPAFDDARVTKVAASRTQQKESKVDDATTEPQAPAAPADAPGLTLSQEQMTTLLTRPGAVQALLQQPQPQPSQAPATPPGSLTLSADQIDVLIRNGALGTILGVPQLGAAQPEPEPQRQVVDPTRRNVTASLSVSEEEPYRFDRRGNLTRGKFDFSTDLIHGLRDGNGEALERAQSFMQAQFDKAMRAEFVNQADAATLNPSRQRPDLYVDQREFEYPIWNAINKGTIPDATPFVLPKFSSSSGLVAAHVENTEPTPGTFVATAQTITPSAVSGKVEISREAWDQGGNPQLSGLIWNQMTRAWFEALEASAVTLLQGAAPTTITLTAGAVDSALEASLTSQLAPLQYVRGGFRMRDFFIQVDLYKALIAAKDTAGRKLFPVLGAQNATGTTQDFFSAVLVAGLVGRPAWALAASSANAENSYLFDRGDVSGWATAPMRLTFDNISVAKVHVGIWGYKALAITDLTGVRRVTYDSVIP